MNIVTVRKPNGAEEKCRSVSGNWGAILNMTGIDIRELPQVMNGSGVALVSKDGHQWTVDPWKNGGGFAVASRKLTDVEADLAEQEMLRGTIVGHFTKDRWLMCLDIADRVRLLSGQMRPDHPPSRATRRTLQRKLNRLAQIQAELLLNRSADSSSFEQELEKLL
jgi:hypothetical protein